MPIIRTKIGKGTKVWHSNLVNTFDSVIGKDCSIAAFVEIGAKVIIGDRCRIQAFVFIPSGVTIGNDVFIGPGVIFINDKYPPIPKKDFKPGRVVIEDKVSIGAGALILPPVRIGKGASIGAGAVVTKDVNPGEVMVGIPARRMSARRKSRSH